MKQEKLTEGCKSILIALSGNKYKSSVPEDDVRDFLFYKKKDSYLLLWLLIKKAPRILPQRSHRRDLPILQSILTWRILVNA